MSDTTMNLRTFLLAALLTAWSLALGRTDAAEPCADTRDGEVGEYVTTDIPEYVTHDIPEYVTGDVPEYVTEEIPEYVTPDDDDPRSVTVVVMPTRHVGKKARKQARRAALAATFGGERRRVVEQYGFPRYRHRESGFDQVTEHWTYPEQHLTYVFCRDTLLRTEPY